MIIVWGRWIAGPVVPRDGNRAPASDRPPVPAQGAVYSSVQIWDEGEMKAIH